MKHRGHAKAQQGGAGKKKKAKKKKEKVSIKKPKKNFAEKSHGAGLGGAKEHSTETACTHAEQQAKGENWGRPREQKKLISKDRGMVSAKKVRGAKC